VTGLTATESAEYEANYQAQLTRTLGIWLHLSITARLAPIFWGAFGLIVLAGALVLFVAIPIRAFQWKRRFGYLSKADAEMQTGLAMVRRNTAVSVEPRDLAPGGPRDAPHHPTRRGVFRVGCASRTRLDYGRRSPHELAPRQPPTCREV